MWIVYKALNKKTEMVYYGSTKMTLSRRMGAHYRGAKSSSGFKFHQALRNSIPSDWIWDVIACYDNKEQARSHELNLIHNASSELLIQGIEVKPRVYNSKPGYGKASEELRAKFRAAKIGHTPWNKGKKNIYSGEALEAMRLAKLGNKNRIKNMVTKQKDE